MEDPFVKANACISPFPDDRSWDGLTDMDDYHYLAAVVRGFAISWCGQLLVSRRPICPDIANSARMDRTRTAAPGESSPGLLPPFAGTHAPQ